jgi:hypothetical protein
LKKDQSLVGRKRSTATKRPVFSAKVKQNKKISRPSEISQKNSKHTQKGLGYTVFAGTAAERGTCWLSSKNLTKEGKKCRWSMINGK